MVAWGLAWWDRFGRRSRVSDATRTPEYAPIVLMMMMNHTAQPQSNNSLYHYSLCQPMYSEALPSVCNWPEWRTVSFIFSRDIWSCFAGLGNHISSESTVFIKEPTTCVGISCDCLSTISRVCRSCAWAAINSRTLTFVRGMTLFMKDLKANRVGIACWNNCHPFPVIIWPTHFNFLTLHDLAFISWEVLPLYMTKAMPYDGEGLCQLWLDNLGDEIQDM